MKFKFLELKLFCLLFPFFCSSAFSLEKKQYECMPSPEIYLSSKFGMDYKNDGNISIEKIRGSPFLWVVDSTPMVNPERALLEVKKTESCVVLYAPLSNSIFFEWGKNFELPKKVWTETAKTNGFQVIRITYAKEKNRNLYKVSKCEKIDGNGNSILVNCSNL
jgi:hypothetical protein